MSLLLTISAWTLSALVPLSIVQTVGLAKAMPEEVTSIAREVINFFIIGYLIEIIFRWRDASLHEVIM